MTLSEIAFGLAFVGGALVVAWGYTLTDRGRSAPRDIERANRGSRWWMRKAVLARHWPLIALITAYVFGFGFIAAQFP